MNAFIENMHGLSLFNNLTLKKYKESRDKILSMNR
jgi:hypothetical protein